MNTCHEYKHIQIKNIYFNAIDFGALIRNSLISCDVTILSHPSQTQ